MADLRKKGPIGIELVKKGLITEADIELAMAEQSKGTNKKIGDILYKLNVCDPKLLIEGIGEILGEKGILLTENDIQIEIAKYIAFDTIKENKVIPFEVAGNRIKVCFADTANTRNIETVRLILLNKGLVMDRYITFESNIEKIVNGYETTTTKNIDSSKDITGLVDSIIKNAIEKRASDIHIEPLEDVIRLRYRIDGELLTITTIPKDKQSQVIGRLKAISNMYQEKQESQDGRITMYPTHNIRVSSQKNIFGEKFVLRLLKKNSDVKSLFELGFPDDEAIVKQCFNKRNSVAIIAAPTGEGKTTTLYSVIDYLNKPEINITTIEDPVEIRIAGLNQIEMGANVSFSDSLRTVLRQDPDIVLVGEIRDEETAEISVQAGHTGHYVLSTIHTIDAIEAITRLRKLNISNYDIASCVATCISQRLIRKLCTKCRKEREFNEKEKDVIESLIKKYDLDFAYQNVKTYDPVGCDACNNTGFFDRIGVFEILILNDEIKKLIVEDKPTIDIKEEALKGIYKPLAVDGINKVLQGFTTLEELNKKLVIY